MQSRQKFATGNGVLCAQNTKAAKGTRGTRDNPDTGGTRDTRGTKGTRGTRDTPERFSSDFLRSVVDLGEHAAEGVQNTYALLCGGG